MKYIFFLTLTLLIIATSSIGQPLKDSVVDIEGNVYHTLKIGSQIWMLENLTVTKFNDGKEIPLILDSLKWDKLVKPGYCWYYNDPLTYKKTYGALYNWYTVNTGKLCPVGWHVPSLDEWEKLSDFLGGDDVAGGKLKEVGTSHWTSPNKGADNSSGFTALPGGYRSPVDTKFIVEVEGSFGNWWTSTESDKKEAYEYCLNYYSSELKMDGLESKAYGFSVRCLSDLESTDNSNLKVFEKPIIEWVEIPAGTYTMGSPTTEVGREDDETQHKVTLNAFKMSKYEVTFEQYDLFCEATNREKPSDEGWGRGDRPVINVSWNDATAFAEWIGCRLPTESEWEYAYRAGTTGPFSTGENVTTDQANYDGTIPYNNNTKGEYRKKTLTVGSFNANAWGLYDMIGNVWEWCSDWYNYYPTVAQTNPQGSDYGINRVLRGGSWDDEGKRCRAAARGTGPSDYKLSIIGFRIVSSKLTAE
jgi:formylglycine-generating enzyme